MTSVSNALIVGGGIGGLSAAIALANAGVEVDLVEINPASKVVGVGILLQGNMIRACQALGVAGQCVEAGFGSSGRRQFDVNGENPLDIPGWSTPGLDYPNVVGITRPEFARILSEAATRAGARIRYGVTFSDLDPIEGGVRVRLSSGHTVQYDLVVGADGLYSKVREALFGTAVRPEYAGQGCFRCNLPRPPQVDRVHLYVGPNGRAGFVPLRDDLMYLLFTCNLPGNPWMPAEKLHEILKDFLSPFGGLVGQVRDTQLNDPAQIIYKPFEVVQLSPPWFKGRIVLIGDAAHATTAHLGQAGAMAVEDAVVLGQEIAKDGDISAVLSAFMARRYARCKFIVDASYQIARWEQEANAQELKSVQLTKQMLELVRQPI